jgi:pheromone alpha factor receptor
MSAVPTPNVNSPAWNLYVDQQNVTLISADGTPVNVSLQSIDETFYFYIEVTISYAFAVGVTSILMIVLLILSDRKKARHPVFILNFLALFFQCLKGIINIAGECSQWAYGVGESLFQLQAQYSQASIRGINTLFTILDLIIYPLVLASLILQIRIVFAATPKTRLFITLFLVAGALFQYATLFAYTVWILQIYYGSPESFNVFTMLYNMWNISFVVFVGICSVLLLFKLLVTIKRRKSMGFKSFGPLHVLAIVFGQCLIVPRIALVMKDY